MKPFAIVNCEEDWLQGKLLLYENGTTSCRSVVWYAENGVVVISNGHKTFTLDAPNNYSAGNKSVVEHVQARVIKKAGRKSMRERIDQKKREQRERLDVETYEPKIASEIPCKFRGTEKTKFECGSCPGARPSLLPCNNPDVPSELCLVDSWPRVISKALNQGHAICSSCEHAES